MADDFSSYGINVASLGNYRDPGKALETLEATTRAEAWFFDRVRGKLADVRPLESYDFLKNGEPNDHLLSFAQFLYLLRALDCTSADAIGVFIDSHNKAIEARIKACGGEKTPTELKKALFPPRRRSKVVASIKSVGRPVFSIYEYGYLLIDKMSAKTADNLIFDLEQSKILIELEDPDINADSRRRLFASTGFLEETYEQSLLAHRMLLIQSLDAEEINRIRGMA